MDSRPTVVDLFCGAGGLSEGFRQAGYSVLLGSDIDPTFGDTFSRSHEGAVFVAKPIQALDSTEIFKLTGLRKGQLEVLVGGPPCQGYSVYNHGRGEHDPRAGLFREYLRIVRELEPKWLVMENVTGLLSISGGKLVQTISDEIAKLGYNVEWRVVRAEDYGVPQERRRVIFIANRVGISIPWPKIEYGEGLKPFTTIWDAIGDLPSLNGRIATEYPIPPSNNYQSEMRLGNPPLSNHYGPKLGKANQERIRHIPQGGSWRDIPFEMLPEGMKRAKRSDHTKRYGRPRLTDLSCTILTKCDIHWGAYIHPIENRAFTVREAARLQSFPDKFVFYGSMTEQFVQIGNAVPPMMAKSIATGILRASSLGVRIAA
ncbi:MAG: DNA cytosine methyltransferase [Sphingomonadales bacterium]|nr:DNA cytosine methyltransferase [Sphingomonadales bacterium]